MLVIRTYQDFVNSSDKLKFAVEAIDHHKGSHQYKTAVNADAYDKQHNVTVLNYVKTIWSMSGSPIVDFTAANNKITSNFFRRLNIQRNTYLLGNGVTFAGKEVKDKLGKGFDTILKKLGYKALIHGVVFGFWNYDRLHIFTITEFVPLFDEDTKQLKAGIRFWQVGEDKPMFIEIYEIDGFAKYKYQNGIITEVLAKQSYKIKMQKTVAGGVVDVQEENYSNFPIIPMYGSELNQSTLEGMQRSIDSFDLIRSGFANDLTDVAQIYWIVENGMGMRDEDLARFRDRLLLNHVATVDTGDGTQVKPYTQEIPYEARSAYLDRIRQGIYEDFGALDTKNLSASAKTATEINSAYQPLDENADDYEYEVIQFVQQVLSLQGVEDTPIFKRNRVANALEQTEMVMLEAPYLDTETILKKLPNISPDEIAEIMRKRGLEETERLPLETPPFKEEEE